MHHGEKQLDANGEISEERQRPMQHLGEQRPRSERFHQGECRNHEMKKLTLMGEPFFISITTNALIHNFLPNLLSSVTHEPVAVFTANRGD